MKSFLTLILFLSTIFSYESPYLNWNELEKIENAEFLVTYPKSGTNWTVCILQILAGRQIQWATASSIEDNLLIHNRLRVPLNLTKPPIYRDHCPSVDYYNIDQSKNKLVVLLRNYKECIVRNLYITEKELVKEITSDQKHFSLYISNLNLYHNWKDENTKLLIYYEDLIQKPRQTIEKLLAFLEEPLDGLEDFFDNYDYWKNKAISSYKRQYGHNISSGGQKEIHHSKDFSIQSLHKIDQHIQETYPELWENYLSRYAS